MRRTTKIKRNFLHCTINSWYGLTVWQAANFSLLLATGCGVLGGGPLRGAVPESAGGTEFRSDGGSLGLSGQSGAFSSSPSNERVALGASRAHGRVFARGSGGAERRGGVAALEVGDPEGCGLDRRRYEHGHDPLFRGRRAAASSRLSDEDDDAVRAVRLSARRQDHARQRTRRDRSRGEPCPDQARPQTRLDG